MVIYTVNKSKEEVYLYLWHRYLKEHWYVFLDDFYVSNISVSIYLYTVLVILYQNK